MNKTASQIADEVLDKCALSLGMMTRALKGAKNRRGTGISALESTMSRAPRTTELALKGHMGPHELQNVHPDFTETSGRIRQKGHGSAMLVNERSRNKSST